MRSYILQYETMNGVVGPESPTQSTVRPARKAAGVIECGLREGGLETVGTGRVQITRPFSLSIETEGFRYLVPVSVSAP
jgi:hypothetical protein